MGGKLAGPVRLDIEKKMRVFEWCCAQCTSREIAARLNLDFPTFLASVRDDPELTAIMESGQSFGTSEVKLQLYLKAKEGNVPAMKGFLDHVTKTWELMLQAEGRQPRVVTIDGVARPGPLLIDAEDHDARYAQQRAYAAESLNEIDPETGEVCDLPGPSREKRKAGLA